MKKNLYVVESNSYDDEGEKLVTVVKALTVQEALSKFIERYFGEPIYRLSCYEVKEEEHVKGLYELYFNEEDFAED